MVSGAASLGQLASPRADMTALALSASASLARIRSGESAHSHVSLELQKNLEALGLSVSRPASPTQTPEPAPEDGRPTTPVNVTTPSLSLKETFEVRAFPNASAFLEALRPAAKNWRINALLGPAAAIVREEAMQLRAAEHAYELPSELRLWLGCYDEGRLSIVLSKIGKGPVVIASPLDAEAIPQTRLLRQLSLVANKLRALLPDVAPTPGAVLAKPFASLWLNISPAVGSELHAPVINSEFSLSKPLRAYGYSLTQLPRRVQIPSMSLVDLISIRLAKPNDDIASLTSMYEEFSRATPGPVDRHTARRIVKSAIATENLWIYYMQSAQSPAIDLIAGFLMLGSETSSSIAITALFTTDIYRDRGVAEALLRSACREVFEQPTKSSIVALIPDPGVARRGSPVRKDGANPTVPPCAVRLFARVGFRTLEKTEWTLCSVWDGVEVNEGSPALMQEPFSPTSPSRREHEPVLSPSAANDSSSDEDDDSPQTPVAGNTGMATRCSSERWCELIFEGVSKSEDMRWAHTL